MTQTFTERKMGEFRERFPYYEDNEDYDMFKNNPNPSEVKAFLTESLEQQKEQILRSLRGNLESEKMEIEPIDKHYLYGGESKTATEAVLKKQGYDREMWHKFKFNNLVEKFISRVTSIIQSI